MSAAAYVEENCLDSQHNSAYTDTPSEIDRKEERQLSGILQLVGSTEQSYHASQVQHGQHLSGATIGINCRLAILGENVEDLRWLSSDVLSKVQQEKLYI